MDLDFILRSASSAESCPPSGGVRSHLKEPSRRWREIVESTTGSETHLRGRHAETRALHRLIANARAGTSGVLVVRGEAGVGKTALLDFLEAIASDSRLVRTSGVESEMELPFAALHQLCAPFLDRREHLPAPQHDALSIAFGLTAGPSPDRFMIGLAVLSLLSDAVEDQPLVCLVDDAQWLDRASAQVLGFVARRLANEAVVLVFAVRERADDRDLVGLPELSVGPISDNDAHLLLASAFPGKLDESVLDRVVAEAHGNPLALLELPRLLTPAAFAGGFGLPSDVPVSARIEESFSQRLTPLPDPTRRLLLVAAAEPYGDPKSIWAAGEYLGVPADAAWPAIAAGLLDPGTQLRFRHPLVRSVVYRDASPADRRLVHEALAESMDSELDPDRRAWHLAQATEGQDEDVAGELEQSADRARARGGLAAAAAFLGRAADLTVKGERRAIRLLAAAQANLDAGAFDAALMLLAAAETGPLDDVGRARVELLYAEVAFAQNRGSEASRLLLQAAKKLEPIDVRLSRNTYLDAWSAALFAGSLAINGGSLEDVSRAALSAPSPTGRPLSSDLLLDGLALFFTNGVTAATPKLQSAVASFAGAEVSVEEMLRWGWLATRAANLIWDYDHCLEIGMRAAQLARDSGALEVLAVADNAAGQAAAMGGDFESAALLAAEVEAVKEATGTRLAPHGALALAGIRGQETEASEMIGFIVTEATTAGQGTAVQYANWAKSVLMNGLGRYPEALAAAVEASENTPPIHITTWALVELIEASTRTGEGGLAEAALTRLDGAAGASDSDWAFGIKARSRALVTQGEEAESLYREAISRLGRTLLRPDLARAHLLFGEWLRREGRRVDAREQLRTAYDLFTEIGMEAFAGRAHAELLATGETVRKRNVETLTDLTPQELQVARLASDGLTNSEIGARLFLSPRTIEWHLRKVFVKLGISSRRELRAALPNNSRRAISA